ncbi:MAG: thermosome subunit beta [Thermoplasmata archaeon]
MIGQGLGQGTPVIILKEGTSREKGKGAVYNNIAAAKAVADAVRTTLGPRGMDKMLVDSLGDVVITNDGVTILKEIDVEHPAAKMMVEVAKTQDQQCGDGTTTAVILAGELLKKAEELLDQNVHPTIIAKGFNIAAEEAINALRKKIAFEVKPEDEETLKKIAITAMNSKGVGLAKDKLAEIAVKAVKAVISKKDGKLTFDPAHIKIEKKHGGSVEDTTLIDGVLIDKERAHPKMPVTVKDAKIALINSALEIKKGEFDTHIQIKDPSKLQMFLDEEQNALKRKVDIIKKSGANVVFCQKGIDDVALHFMAKEGIFAIKQMKESDMVKLARATGARIVTALDDLSEADLGSAALVEEKKIGDSKMTFVTGCKNPKSVSILIRGGTEHVVAEIERSLNDAIRVVGVTMEDGLAVSGGGSTEIELALHLRDFAPKVSGREQLAVEAFARALEVVPWALAENAGLDAINILIDLRASHEGKHGKTMGVDVLSGKVADMLKLNVIEPVRVKTQAIHSATESAVMILRIDDIIAAKKSEPPKGGEGGGPGGMPGGMPEY